MSAEEWTQYFNDTWGSGITRRNAVIYTPIVNSFTLEKRRYNDGSTNPPKVVKEWTAHNLPAQKIPAHRRETAADHYRAMDANPNFTQGNYFPDYHKRNVYYDLPEQDTNGFRKNPDGTREQIPLHILRGI